MSGVEAGDVIRVQFWKPSSSGTTTTSYNSSRMRFYVSEENGDRIGLPNAGGILAERNYSLDLSSVTNIGDYTFCNFKTLTSITLSNGLERIGKKAFYGCTALTSVRLPEGVLVGAEAFGGCDSITDVFYNNEKISLTYEKTVNQEYAVTTGEERSGEIVFSGFDDNIVKKIEILSAFSYSKINVAVSFRAKEEGSCSDSLILKMGDTEWTSDFDLTAGSSYINKTVTFTNLSIDELSGNGCSVYMKADLTSGTSARWVGKDWTVTITIRK